MSDDESRHDLPTEGGAIFAENGSETVEEDQTGSRPSWTAALTAQMPTAFAELDFGPPARLVILAFTSSLFNL